ncbi:MAG: UDP-N-acetylmuramate dehydrogenase [Chloroflexi bacterium]|nr:UDP-N-acetylmuramate dehydrogenase [Chloroflexota bacterium]
MTDNSSRLPHGIRREESLARHSSLKVGGPAEYYAEYATSEDAALLLAWAREHGVPVRAIGGGSNLLISERGVDGLVVRATGNRSEVTDGSAGAVLEADAGVTIAGAARRCAKRDFGGLEWASNVPGTVGGAVVNNAGAFGGDTASSLLAAWVVEAGGALRRAETVELGYAYRTSVLKRREWGELLVVRAELRLTRSEPGVADALVKQYQAQRTRTQPRIQSAGSVFANPPGDYSGRLIEAAGLKGVREGGAQVSEQHANFIVNPGGATPRDVYALVQRAQRAVFELHGVWLHPEIELFGRWTEAERDALRHP